MLKDLLLGKLPDAATLADLEQQVCFAVGDGFSAATDGTAERAAILAQRAQGTVDRFLDEANVNSRTRRHLLNLAKNEITQETKQVLM